MHNGSTVTKCRLRVRVCSLIKVETNINKLQTAINKSMPKRHAADFVARDDKK